MQIQQKKFEQTSFVTKIFSDKLLKQKYFQAQMESLEVIRQDYRKNSVKSTSSCVPSEEEDEIQISQCQSVLSVSCDMSLYVMKYRCGRNYYIILYIYIFSVYLLQLYQIQSQCQALDSVSVVASLRALVHFSAKLSLSAQNTIASMAL